MAPYAYLPLICVAIGFSWAGFASVFATGPDTTKTHLAQATAASGIFLSALTCTFADGHILSGLMLVSCGMAIAYFAGRYLTSPWSLAIAAGSFAAYLHVAIA